jgi:hypothetical protein
MHVVCVFCVHAVGKKLVCASNARGQVLVAAWGCLGRRELHMLNGTRIFMTVLAHERLQPAAETVVEQGHVQLRTINSSTRISRNFILFTKLIMLALYFLSHLNNVLINLTRV